MDIVELINHPERMDRDTLYELRSTLALHPYFQTVRLLMLQNLYLLHDPSFDEELRRSAVYITDRRSLFNLVEAAHYQFNPTVKSQQPKANGQEGNRTMALIDTFLDLSLSRKLKRRANADLPPRMPLSTMSHTCWKAKATTSPRIRHRCRDKTSLTISSRKNKEESF